MNKLLGAILLSSLLCSTAQAMSIGAGPSTIDFGRMVRGGYAEQVVTVSTSGEEDLTCTAEFLGDLKDWLNLDKGNKFQVPANSREDLRVILQPPADAVNGRYNGEIYIKAAPTSSVTSGAGLAVGAGIIIKLTTEITGKEDVALTVNGVSIPDTEVGYPVKIVAELFNTGNVKITPKITAAISDTSGNKIVEGEYADTSILPTRIETVPFTVSSEGMTSGQYNADVNVYARDVLVHNQKIGFKVLPKGTLSVNGKLEELKVSPDTISTGEMAKVMAKFKNSGQVPIRGKLRAEAYLNEKLVDVLRESDEMEVEPGDTVPLETYYNPSKPGNYVIRGSVGYGSGKTDQKGTILKVNAPASGSIDYVTYGAVAVIILAIAAYFLFLRKGSQPEYQYDPQDALSQAQGEQYTQPEEAQQQETPPQETQQQETPPPDTQQPENPPPEERREDTDTTQPGSQEQKPGGIPPSP